MNAVFQATIVDVSGNILAGATVEVRREDTGALAVLSANRAGTEGLDNPFQADENGFIRFYAENGLYHITAIQGAQTRVWRHVLLLETDISGALPITGLNMSAPVTGIKDSEAPVTLPDVPASIYNLYVDVGGVRQWADEDFAVIQDELTWLTADGDGETYRIEFRGFPLPLGVPADGSVDSFKINQSDAENIRAAIGLGAADSVRFDDVLALSLNGGPLAGFRNRIINGGAPFVNQRGNQTSIANDYFADRWAWRKVGAVVVDAGVVDDWLEVEVTTADTSIAAGDLSYVDQRVEANNIADFKLGTANAKQVTLSFAHKHTKAGTYCVAFQNSASNRSYVVEYTQDVADTEEEETITLTLDTSGTWATGTSIGLTVAFCASAGSTYQTTADAWQAGSYFATANQVNATDTIGNKFRIRDVQLELGVVATPFERRPFGLEVVLAERYYQIGKARYTAFFNSSGLEVEIMTQTRTKMRATPTGTPTWGNSNVNSPSLTADVDWVLLVGTTAASSNTRLQASFTLDAEL